MKNQKFSNKMNQLNNDNKSYALGRLLITLGIIIVIFIIWLFTN
ncbi:hypothetical protein M2475_001295 [Breznakia sp. PF5-3]|nr:MULTISPECIES: hypothetical protein [unclassified Breznakia]MDF9824869.1 hypothetical protein [Breznakia sp. PM6-1]MDF9835726.1 hypothetical protein [Breznakia sp. PF5-3]MDF9838896.1 hypothetical protein [Breznakia sp. PFB2-8]MDF9860922.1 hypothetical protein [Breznakia sp. PH5-24]